MAPPTKIPSLFRKNLPLRAVSIYDYGTNDRPATLAVLAETREYLRGDGFVPGRSLRMKEGLDEREDALHPLPQPDVLSGFQLQMSPAKLVIADWRVRVKAQWKERTPGSTRHRRRGPAQF